MNLDYHVIVSLVSHVLCKEMVALKQNKYILLSFKKLDKWLTDSWTRADKHSIAKRQNKGENN